MVTSLTSILLSVLALLLLYAGYGDLKARTIPNSLNIAIALLAIPFWWASGFSPWPDMALQVGVAALAFAFFAGAFALGAMGGGDVKLIGAIALWLPVARFAAHAGDHVTGRRRPDFGDDDPQKAGPHRGAAGDSLWGRDRVRRIVDDWPTFFLPIWLMSEFRR